MGKHKRVGSLDRLQALDSLKSKWPRQVEERGHGSMGARRWREALTGARCRGAALRDGVP